MDSILSKQLVDKTGFVRVPIKHYDCTMLTLALPTFDVSKMVDRITIDFNLDDIQGASEIGSTLLPSMSIDVEDMANFVHDFTFGHLADKTDRLLMREFPMMNDGFDHLSPDMIIKTTSGMYNIVEFTTFRGDERGAFQAAMTKLAKYEVPCENRSQGRTVVLYVVSAYRHGVWSNLELEDSEAEEMVYRYRLALSVMDELRTLFPELSSTDEELGKTERELLAMVSSIQINWSVTESVFPPFSREMFDRFRSSPPDSEYITRIVSRCLINSQEKLINNSFFAEGNDKALRFSKNAEECSLAVERALNQYRAEDNLRDLNDHKSTIQLPPWLSYHDVDGKDLCPLQGLDVRGDHPMCNLWREVVTSANLEEIERMHDDAAAELEFALSGVKDRPDERNRYHRVHLNMGSDDSVYIAALGVNGKKHKADTLVQQMRDRSKQPFSPDHDVDHISEFLSACSSDLWATDEDLYNPLSCDKELRLAAQRIHQPSLSERGFNEIITEHYKFMGSRIGSWCQMVSLIGAELSASVKQHVKPNYFVIKRLLGSGIFLLIKPTSSKSHIFVSFAIKRSCWAFDLSTSRVFKPYIDAGDLLVTDFVSYKLSKLTNLCKCVSLMESSFSFWAEAFGIPSWNFVGDLFRSSDSAAMDASYMGKLSLLTLLEDKATTEELQTIARYIIMEGFVSPPEIPKPHKMTSKFPKVLRSELQVYLLNCLCRTIQRIAGEPFILKKKDGSISWGGMFNPFSGRPLLDMQPLISCCYNGYFKNKEEETEPSSLSGMYKKIIELEHLRPQSDAFLGYKDPELPRMHEFSVSYLKEACNHAKLVLRSLYGQNFMEQIDNQIIRELSGLTLERLATLKATSNFNENWYVYKDVADKNYTRDKLLVKMSKYASEGKSLAIQKFEDCMRQIESQGCMHICLFKKQQHGGLREIYVMGAEERIVQSVVETIARSIGKFFASDTLCNPPNKVKIPETHGIRARKQCKGPVWTCATSDDARKWNQGHFVTKFALMLCEFTSPKWWPLIIRGCSMFTRKRMMMNLNYLKILDGHRELDIRDDFVMDLFKAYHGEAEVPWAFKGKTYLETTTGMMQGILHYTSSLLHTIHQEYIRSLSFKIFNLKVAPEMSKSLVCDMMQGSDDSSMLISFPADDEKVLTRCKVAAAICFRMKKELGVYLAIYPSEKSTANTDFVMEYNSEFYFHTQHVRPTIRWIAACCSLPEVETLVARQEEASNLMTSVTEGGGSFSLAAMIQQAQCTLHYMLMGMGVSELFLEYKKAVLKWNDPGLGFFLLDNPYACGLGGFRFNLFKAITRTDLQKLYAFFMKKVKGSAARDWADEDVTIPETCSVSPGGALILSSSLKWGSRKKFQKLRDRLNIPENWIELINENPEVLYRAPRTGPEILLRIAEKVHSPGVVSSLSSGNAVCKVMASAVYFLSATIFEDTGRPEFNFLEDSKYSLLQKMAAYSGFHGFNDMEPEDILFLFPNIEELESLDSIVYNKGEIDIIPRVNIRDATQTRVTIFNEQKTLRTSPEKLVSDKWFGTQKSRIGKTTFLAEWEKLKKIVKWLEDTPEATLAHTPLNNHIQVRNFFARMESKPRTVRITGAPVKKRSGVSKIAMVIRDNFSRMGHLRGVEDLAGFTRSVSAEILKHFLFCILQGPYSESYKLQLIYRVLSSVSNVEIKESDGKTKTNLIGILQRFLDGDHVVPIIEEMGAGTVGGFIKRQQSKVVQNKVVYYGVGIWRGFMDGHQVHLEIENDIGQPPRLRNVTTNCQSSPWDLSIPIRQWAEDMGVTNNQDYSSKSSRGARYWMHSFRMQGPSKPFGCPVYIIKGDMSDVIRLRKEEVEMKVRGSTLNLYTKHHSHQDLHILSYTASDNDLSPGIFKSISDEGVAQALQLFEREPSNCWVRCESVAPKFISAILEICEGKRQIKGINRTRLSEIVRICSESSLRSKVGSMFSFVANVEEAHDVDYDALMDLMIEDAKNNAFSHVVNCIELDVSGPYEMESFDTSDVNLFGPAHYKDISSLSMIAHPLMDKFVDYAISKMGRASVRKVLETGRCSSKDYDLSKVLFRTLQRPEESIRIDDLELYEETDVADDMLG
uniref:RNA-directed RNA polymerase L n=1 Tax=Rift valley fever virus TaxID=11588 RepID=A0A830Q5Y2_RVFV|nr:polymerase [Rift Valley fever virus]